MLKSALACPINQNAVPQAPVADRDAEGGVPVIEEIELGGCFGTDTMVLEADVLRAAQKLL